MNQTIASAIAKKEVLRLEYHGFYRIVEPHAYGINHLGHEVLRCYQTGGGSKSGKPLGWRLLRLDETHAITTTGSSFAGARPNYDRDDKGMSSIYAQL